MKITVNTITNQVLFTHEPSNLQPVKKAKQRESTKGWGISRKQVARLRNITGWLDRTYKGQYLFVTITTCQHKNGLTDSECNQILSKWLELRKKQNIINSYLWVAERQKKTGDIHYHIILLSNDKINIPDNVKYLMKAYKGTGTNVFNVEKVQNKVGAISSYMLKSINKYLTKNADSQSIKARPSQISHDLIKAFKLNANQFIQGVNSYDFDLNQEYEYICNALTDFKPVFSNDFVVCYKLHYKTVNKFLETLKMARTRKNLEYE